MIDATPTPTDDGPEAEPDADELEDDRREAIAAVSAFAVEVVIARADIPGPGDGQPGEEGIPT
jgi:hypothetical protein